MAFQNRLRSLPLFIADLVAISLSTFAAAWIVFPGKIGNQWILDGSFILAGICALLFSGQYSQLIKYIDSKIIMRASLFLGIFLALVIPVVSIVVTAEWILLLKSGLIYLFFTSVLWQIIRLGAPFPISLLESHLPKNSSPFMKTLIYGAGEAGSMVMNEIRKHPEFNLQVVGFIDDNEKKWGMRISDCKVLGGKESLIPSVKKLGVQQLIIAIPTASGSQIRSIIDSCSSEKSLKIKIVPCTREIIAGSVHWKQIRDVAVEDLLGREEIKVNDKDLFRYIRNRRVLITGAGGSIGSELVRQTLQYCPERVILLGKGEHSIYQIHSEVKRNFPRSRILPYICDIKDKDSLMEIFVKERPDLVFHAAAHKHVPLMEANPKEAFRNNVLGTRNLIDCAVHFHVERFVLISTDKAVNPTSVMGATKRIAEILLQIASQKHRKTRFSAVRFGNVLGSRGSVIPLFKEQIQRGGPVTITHRDIIRYFMTIPEAVSLVMQAGADSKGGEIFILDMGKPVKIHELALNLIRLSGLEPGKDIKIRFTGLRPGEKLFEELLTEAEGISATKSNRIFVARVEKHDNRLLEKIDFLKRKMHTLSDQQFRKEIFRLLRY